MGLLRYLRRAWCIYQCMQWLELRQAERLPVDASLKQQNGILLLDDERILRIDQYLLLSGSGLLQSHKNTLLLKLDLPQLHKNTLLWDSGLLQL